MFHLDKLNLVDFFLKTPTSLMLEKYDSESISSHKVHLDEYIACRAESTYVLQKDETASNANVNFFCPKTLVIMKMKI